MKEREKEGKIFYRSQSLAGNALSGGDASSSGRDIKSVSDKSAIFSI
jgi:hypothetical protein